MVLLGRAYVAGVYAFVFLPLVLVLLISFSGDSYLNFPPGSWSLRWYETLLDNRAFIAAAQRSFLIALVVTAASLALGIPAAYAIARMEFRGRGLVQTLLFAPLLLPTLVLALAMLLVFYPLGLAATYPGLVLAHLAICLPFAVRVLTTSLSVMPPDLEDAAATLGARPLEAFRYVTLPLLRPGIVAAGALSATLSFDEIVISLFIVGPRLSTLPVEIYRYVDERTDPLIAAVAVVLITVTLLTVMLVERTVGFMRAFGR
ncbi:MAG TPA: ABC transporter permease [Thermodesulfobacteriota bacterium]